MHRKIKIQHLFHRKVIIGMLAGLALWVIGTLFLRPNMIVAILAIYITIQISGVSEPRDIGVISGFMGAIVGLSLVGTIFYNNVKWDTGWTFSIGNLAGLILTAFIGAVMIGMVIGFVGFVVGRILKPTTQI